MRIGTTSHGVTFIIRYMSEILLFSISECSSLFSWRNIHIFLGFLYFQKVFLCHYNIRVFTDLLNKSDLREMVYYMVRNEFLPGIPGRSRSQKQYEETTNHRFGDVPPAPCRCNGLRRKLRGQYPGAVLFNSPVMLNRLSIRYCRMYRSAVMC
jgi:hypothetical protein